MTEIRVGRMMIVLGKAEVRRAKEMGVWVAANVCCVSV